MNKKITVVGAGAVGTNCARRIVEKDLADVTLIDVVEGLPQGKALDIMESASLEGFQAKVKGANDYQDTKNSDLAIITAGIARKPGMSRDELQATNAGIVAKVTKKIIEVSPQVILIVVTNPLDVMSYLAWKVSGLDPKKVIGMAGLLDTARYQYFLSEQLSVAPSQIEAMVLGGHGDLMVPVTRYSKLKDRSILKLLAPDTIEAINQRTRKGGAEIVGLLKTSSAYYAPSSAVVEMVKAILSGQDKVLPCSAYLNGQYGINDVFCGVPVRLSRAGIEEIIQLDLTEEESSALELSAEAVKANIAKLKL